MVCERAQSRRLIGKCIKRASPRALKVGWQILRFSDKCSLAARILANFGAFVSLLSANFALIKMEYIELGVDWSLELLQALSRKSLQALAFEHKIAGRQGVRYNSIFVDISENICF